MRGRWASVLACLGSVAVLLLLQTGCLEGFERLITTVRYDPHEHVFTVERLLQNVDPEFFGCSDAERCVDAIERALVLAPPIDQARALSDRLVARLLDSGAEDVELVLEEREGELDVRVTYRARLGTQAAEDTLVHAEYTRRGSGGRYYLVIDAQESMDRPQGPHRIRKHSQSGASGVTWREFWVLPGRRREVTTRMDIASAVRPILEAVPGLVAALDREGWLEDPQDAVAMAEEPSAGVDAMRQVPPAKPEPEPEREPDPEPEPDPLPAATDALKHAPEPEAQPAPPPLAQAPAVVVPAAHQPDPMWPPPDPDSPAKVYVHEARVTGRLPVGVAERSVQPLIPRVRVCYQRRWAEQPAVAGYAFLEAVVRGDGFIVSTSVYGDVGDPPLLRCLEAATEGWSLPAYGSSTEVSEVALPLTFRVEMQPGGRKRKR